MHINSNIFYRITNVALGTSFSLDVANPEAGTPSGLVDITPSGLFSGQVWQFLNPSQSGKGPYYLSSSFLGPQKKLDVDVGEKAQYIPFLRNLTTAHDQTWIVTAHNDSSHGSNATTYSLAPQFLGGEKFLSVKNDTKQPFLDDAGGTNQHWMLTPVMQINDAAFSTSALWEMATQVSLHVSILDIGANITMYQTATSTASTKSTALPSSSPVAEKGTTQYTIPKSAIIAMIAAPITLVFALCILTSMFLHVRRCQRRKQAAIIDQKLESAWRDSGSQIYYGSRPPFATAPARTYTPSIASSGEFGRSTQPDSDFNPLDPRPPSRPKSWIRGRDNQPFFGASALGNNMDERESPISPVLPAELAAGSRRGSLAEIEEVSPRSPFIPSRENEMDRETRSASSRSMRRQVSLISRWKL
jgi:hypothetical protein